GHPFGIGRLDGREVLTMPAVLMIELETRVVEPLAAGPGRGVICQQEEAEPTTPVRPQHPGRFLEIMGGVLGNHMGEDRSCEDQVLRLVRHREAITGGRQPARWIVEAVAHIGPVELKVGMCGVKGALAEFDLVAIDVESEIGPPTDDVAQRKRYPALPTAYLQNPAAESQVAVHPEQHAPFLS